jgi:hypothetical protein
MSEVENSSQNVDVPVANDEANAEEPNVTMQVETNDASTQTPAGGVEAEEDAVAESSPPATLNINTLVQVKNLLDVAIARGMVKPNEMSVVGGVYDRYVTGLNTLLQQSQASESSAESNEVSE